MTMPLDVVTTFAVKHVSRQLVTVNSPSTLLAAWQQACEWDQPALILGGGSNVLFVDDFAGTVIINRIMGVRWSESAEYWQVHAGAGEIWHQLLENALALGRPGLENLALIPGCVGAAPIQNIGAYGVELQQFCDYVDCLELSSGHALRLNASECQFGYRESIFKHAVPQRYAIVAVGLKLAKHWRPVLSYGELGRLDAQMVTPRQVFDMVCRQRRARLPDPARWGNAGSFFKNPLVSPQQAVALLAQYPQMPCYPQQEGQVKLAAGWLIDQCQLKGYRLGAAAVHEQQALVIVNSGNASSDQIVSLARLIRQRVADKFAVWLEPEVRFIGAQGEVDAVAMIS